MRYIFFAMMLSAFVWAQDSDSVVVDYGTRDSVEIFRPTIQDYQYFTQFSEKKVFDTVFTIDKSYQFTQYNNKDNFGKIQFPNIGGGFQDLVYRTNSEQDLVLLPSKKSHFIIGIKDIKYYNVKTPTTAFYYHNGMGSGGTLQSTYTQNIGKRFNFSVEYMGLRSEGLYQRDLASSNNTIFSAYYSSKNEKYRIFAHFIHQNILNEENGGLSNLENFVSGDSRFSNRQNLSVNLNNTYTKFSIRRYYFSHSFSPFDVQKFPFSVKHTFYHQTNQYRYIQQGFENYYSSNLIAGLGTHSDKKSTNLSNVFTLHLDRERFKLEAGLRYQVLDYKAITPLIISGLLSDSEWKENRLGIVGSLEMKLWHKIQFQSDLEVSRGKSFGNLLRSENYLTFEPLKGYFVNGHIHFKSATPTFNYLMNNSFYQDYNYKNLDFKNQNILEIGADVHLDWLNSKWFVNYFRVHQMAYFDEFGLPKQNDTAINISQIGGEATFSYRKFHLNGRLLWQNVLNDQEILPLPKIIARANLYYQNKIFKKAAELQTGLKAYYFSKVASREYFPILNEFILPSSAHSIGGKPIADFYVNLKVKRMMIYAEAQHFNTSFMKNQSYAAPFYPIADFRLNLGLVWYLFH